MFVHSKVYAPSVITKTFLIQLWLKHQYEEAFYVKFYINASAV